MCFSQPAYRLDQGPVTTVQSCLLRMIAIGILLPRSPIVDNRSRKIQTSSSFETCFLSIKNSPRGGNSHRSRRNVSVSAQAPPSCLPSFGRCFGLATAAIFQVSLFFGVNFLFSIASAPNILVLKLQSDTDACRIDKLLLPMRRPSVNSLIPQAMSILFQSWNYGAATLTRGRGYPS
jgi:hypothetical protein